LEDGVVVYYFAEARDAIQSARSEVRVLRIVDPAKLRQEKVEALGNVLARLERVLQVQNAALARTDQHRRWAIESKPKQPLKAQETEAVLKAQLDIRAEVAEVCRALAPSEAYLEWVREALVALLAKPLPAAVVAAERVHQRAAQPPELVGPLNELAAQQRLIVAGLKAILQILPKSAETALDEVETKRGHDLPNEVKKDLADLKDKLTQFGDEQRKAVNATEELAKKPVEDLTADDKKELEKLKALEDKWEKFLKEAYSDLSKTPKQDFSDPRLLRELVQTYEEVELAKDALSKKAAEIAVALEEAGLENAKEITTNLERWLPDTPDRQKWSMEEPIGEGRTPMAELPKELEDLIGDLLEQEEDLLAEADDVTSKWADSLDKGAGWDAMDGPISNMSAKGVTGNMLPNSSEIGGRSGEGRTGKSSGQLVGEETVGKGGRRTPTRLTPDPFEAGKVKDSSKDPAGGATGGGKEGGAGGQGLEGPVPPSVKQSLERLAGRQADLRNKAEKIALQMRVMNYPSADLEKAVKQMKEFEKAAKDGRYTNLARQRDVLLKDLGAAQRFAEGVARITRDGAPNLPRQVQDEILDALSGQNVPVGYEELLKGYYESLSKPAAPPPAPAAKGAGDLLPRNPLLEGSPPATKPAPAPPQPARRPATTRPK
jgi:hypothetical protein